jgi:hypothetical protein
MCPGVAQVELYRERVWLTPCLCLLHPMEVLSGEEVVARGQQLRVLEVEAARQGLTLLHFPAQRKHLS